MFNSLHSEIYNLTSCDKRDWNLGMSNVRDLVNEKVCTIFMYNIHDTERQVFSNTVQRKSTNSIVNGKLFILHVWSLELGIQNLEHIAYDLLSSFRH